MRPQYLCYTFVACCLFKLVRCEYQIKNATSNSSYSTNAPNMKSVLANHRLNSQEVPMTNTTQAVSEANSTVVGPSSPDFPFNVDFVEQPEMFEIGQSFFLPTIRSPSGEPIPRPWDSDRSSNGRWSKPFELSNTISQVTRDLEVANSPSSPASRNIVFDDENDDNWAQAEDAFQFNRSNTTSKGINEPQRLKQLKLDLERQEAEKRKLISLLGRRLAPKFQDVKDALSTRGSFTNHNDKFIPLPNSGGLISGLVPSNHIVKHPKAIYKLKQASRERSRATHRHDVENDSFDKSDLSPSHISRGDPVDAVQYSLPIFTASTSTLTDTNPPTRPNTFSRLQPNSHPITLIKHTPSSTQMIPVGQQPREDTELKQAVQDYFKSMNQNAFANLPGASYLSSSKFNKLYQDLSESDESGDQSQAPAWRDLPSKFDQFTDDVVERPAGLNSYSHNLFADDAMESVGRGSQRATSVAYRNLRGQNREPNLLKSREKAAFLANNDIRQIYQEDDYKRSYPRRYPSALIDQEAMNSFQTSDRDHDRRHFEELEYFSSPSKKVIHIHKNEKRGHGKYLWPILGGGLTMLMGFLIISNMLLSIPLLAMGASSLFGHGGFHTQQLVPVYNLSQLRPPSGRRRRKRWLDGPEERLDSMSKAAKSITLRDLAFRNMLRRILKSLMVRGNRCKSHF